MYLDSFHNATLLASTGLYSRDFKTQVTPNATQRVTLIVAGCYIIGIGILWYDLFSFSMLLMSICFQACTIPQLYQ